MYIVLLSQFLIEVKVFLKDIQTERNLRPITSVWETALTLPKSLSGILLMLDTMLSYKDQIEHAASRASTVTNIMARIMTNIGGPR